MASRLRLLVLLSLVGLLGSAAPVLASADTTPPVVSAVRLLSGPVLAPGDEIVAEADVSDPSGVREVSLWLQDPAGVTYFLGDVSDQGLPATVTLRRQIDSTWASGAYTLREVGAGDLVGNYAGHLPGGTLDIDFTALSFSVDNPDSVVRTAPVVESLRRVGRAAAGAGQEIHTIVGTSSADGVVRSIGLFYRGPDGVTRQATAYAHGSGRDTLAGETLVVVRPQEDWTPGHHTLEQIVVDGFDGRTAAWYLRDGSLLQQPGAWGQHPVDLAALDFRVTPRG